jgi:beta-lactamase class A
MKSLFQKIFMPKIPMWLLYIVSFFIFFGGYVVAKQSAKKAAAPCPTESCDLELTRTKTQGLVHQLVLADVSNESSQLAEVKKQMSEIISQEKESGSLNAASVYLRSLEDGAWTSINGFEGFHPGSLIKLPIAITLMKQAEDSPGFLSKSIAVHAMNYPVPTQTFEKESTLKIGSAITIRELMFEMLAHSDNLATGLLIEQVNLDEFKTTFTDLGMKEPPVSDLGFTVNATDYSRFLRALYNSSYISAKDSERILEMLSQSNFTEGIKAGLSKDLQSACKFGEYQNNDHAELHESGIIYLNEKPYLLTVMTSGKSLSKLPIVLAKISAEAHNAFSNGK